MQTPYILLTTYPNDGRKLKRLIVAILKQGRAMCIQRLNYAKSYYLWEGEIKKTEEKILIIKTVEKHKEKLTEFIKKQHPYETPELIWIKPEEIDPKYLARLQGN